MKTTPTERVAIKIYIDPVTKENFELVAKEYGFDNLSLALRVYMKACVRFGSLHLDLTPNTISDPCTVEAIDELFRVTKDCPRCYKEIVHLIEKVV